MKIKYCLILPLILAAYAAAAAALEPIAWNDQVYATQFNYFSERGTYTQDSWAGLPPAARESALAEAAAPAALRAGEINDYYAGAMQKWSSARLKDSRAQDDGARLKAVRIWLGAEKSAALERKLSVTGAKLAAAPQGLTAADLLELKPCLRPEAIEELRAMQPAALTPAKQARGAGAAVHYTEALGKFAGPAAPALTANSFSKLYDGMKAAGTDPVVIGSGRYQAGAAGTAPLTGLPARRPALTVPELRPAAADKASAPVSGSSKLWTSDAYGVTIYAANRAEPLTFRKGEEAAAAIRALPDGSINKVIFYGHGSPGLQTVGGFDVDAEGAAAMLKGKMARGALLQYSGCNTSSIGGPTLNPLVGLSMAARRLLYFSLPYFQDRADGIPPEQAKQQWEKGWNADLARDTSLNLRGTVVCGYRTFGLVAGRLPVVTRIAGNQEATTPGYVAGKKGCYRDGQEVPAP